MKHLAIRARPPGIVKAFLCVFSILLSCALVRADGDDRAVTDIMRLYAGEAFAWDASGSFQYSWANDGGVTTWSWPGGAAQPAYIYLKSIGEDTPEFEVYWRMMLGYSSAAPVLIWESNPQNVCDLATIFGDFTFGEGRSPRDIVTGEPYYVGTSTVGAFFKIQSGPALGWAMGSRSVALRTD